MTSSLKGTGPILVLALHKFVTYLLTYLDTHSFTYSPGTHMGYMTRATNSTTFITKKTVKQPDGRYWLVLLQSTCQINTVYNKQTHTHTHTHTAFPVLLTFVKHAITDAYLQPGFDLMPRFNPDWYRRDPGCKLPPKVQLGSSFEVFIFYLGIRLHHQKFHKSNAVCNTRVFLLKLFWDCKHILTDILCWWSIIMSKLQSQNSFYSARLTTPATDTCRHVISRQSHRQRSVDGHVTGHSTQHLNHSLKIWTRVQLTHGGWSTLSLGL